MKRKPKILTSQQIVVLGFTALILLGAVLLWLPISSKDGTKFIDALFTATSSSCVTGLVVKDTASHFNLFGKFVILVMIQIGGMGVITMTTLVAMVIGKRIGVSERNLMKDSISANHIGGIVALTGFIVRTTVIIEALGAVALFFVFLPDYGVINSIEYGIFHSISGFCNAGFDIVSGKAPFSSFCNYVDNPLLNITVMFLIVIGGIGFLTWEDIKTNKFSFGKYRLQTKIILTTTLILVVIPALFFYFFEFSKMAAGSRILASFFQSVTLRTAGFNTVSFDGVSDSGKLIMILLMLIGGAPGSTAGGMKITTVAVLYASVVSVFKRRDNAEIYKRRLPENVIKNAAAIFILYLFLFFIGAVIISKADNLPVFDCMFETASAVGTVGLTLGITPALSSVSKIVLIALMFLGRVGGLTFVFATVGGSKYSENRYPKENVTVG